MENEVKTVKLRVGTLWINDKNKEGVSLVDKKGRHYTRVTVSEGPDAPKYSCLCYNATDKELRIEKGSLVEIDIEKNGEYLNFKLHQSPLEKKEGEVNRARSYLKKLEGELEALKNTPSPVSESVVIEQNDDINIEDVPF